MNELRDQIEQVVDVAMNMGVGYGQEQVTVDQYGNARDRATDRILALIADAMMSWDAVRAAVDVIDDRTGYHEQEYAHDTIQSALTAAGIMGAGQEGGGDE